MTCPQCQQSLSHLDIQDTSGNQKIVEECLNCGGHFLENYLVDSISNETARNIDSVIPKDPHIQAANPVCHKCGQVMSSIRDGESVPQTVTVFQCPNNHGDFYPKGQLYLFKKAEQAKINYHKLWGIPLKTAFAVIVPVFILFSAVTILPKVINELNTSQENRVKASEILTPPLVTQISDSHVLISFSTHKKFTTSIKFVEGKKETIIISETPDNNHLISVDNLNASTTYKYVLVLDPDGQNITTSEYTFSTP